MKSPDAGSWTIMKKNKLHIRKRHYFVIRKDVVPKLDNLTKEQFQLSLQLHSSASFELMETHWQQPIRFVVVSSKDFTSLSNDSNNIKFNCCGNDYIFNHNKTPNFRLCGAVVYVGKNDVTLKDMFTFKDVGAIEESFANGFGNRRCASCLGINLYLGPRLSHRPRQTVACLDEMCKFFSDNCRQNWKWPQALQVRKKVCHAANKMIKVGTHLNPLYTHFVGEDTCRYELLGANDRGRSLSC